MKRFWLSTIFLLGACASAPPPVVLPVVPAGAEAVSLSGYVLRSTTAAPGALRQLAQAEDDYNNNPDSADAIIWYGRRLAYTGQFRRAIEVYSEGINKFPEDARMYRHRGHRYISIRELDRAIADFQKAVQLINGADDQVEPDGLPNARNTPVSTLHSNIWYHLGLSFYLKQDWDSAWRAYRRAYDAVDNPDNKVAALHWLYAISRHQDAYASEVETLLEAVNEDMDIIENQAYHDLCLLYKGQRDPEALLLNDDGTSSGAAVLYGVGNWFYHTGNEQRSSEILNGLLRSDGWASFAYIAAEADLLNR